MDAVRLRRASRLCPGRLGPAGPLPALTAIFSTLPRVEGWAAAGRP